MPDLEKEYSSIEDIEDPDDDEIFELEKELGTFDDPDWQADVWDSFTDSDPDEEYGHDDDEEDR